MGFLANLFKSDTKVPAVETQQEKSYLVTPHHHGGVWREIHEPFAGAWQHNQEERRATLLTYPTLYACIYRISTDIGKLPFIVRRRTESGVMQLVNTSPLYKVLKDPNHYQTETQFREFWMLAKLIWGNTYVLLSRDGKGKVDGMYIMDSSRVLPMVTDAGEVYYQLYTDILNKFPRDYPFKNLVVPGSEIIHDRCNPLFHPLLGVPPVAAAYLPALKNLKILQNAADFFGNNQQPGGLLTAPAGMSEEDAAAVRDYWESAFSGGNSGKIAVIGADMKFTTFAMKSIDSQMIEQTRYSDEQICQPFGIPPFKVGIGTIPAGLGVDGINQLYYNDALQTHIVHMEELLCWALKAREPERIELDLDPLIRMDEKKRAEVETRLVSGKIKTPDEGRAKFNLPPTGGGDTLWGQYQDYPLSMLQERWRWDTPFREALMGGDKDLAELSNSEEAPAEEKDETKFAIEYMQKAVFGEVRV